MNLDDVRAVQARIHAALRQLLPTPEVRESDFDQLMPMERDFFRAFQDTQPMERDE